MYLLECRLILTLDRDLNGEIMKLNWLLCIVISFSSVTFNSLNAQEIIKFQSLDQNFNQPVDGFNFKQDMLQYLIWNEVNLIRVKNYLDELNPEQILNEEAIAQALELAELDLSKPESADFLYESLAEKSCTEEVKFISGKYALKKEGNPVTYSQLAKDIVDAWMLNPKTAELVLSRPERFVGLGAELSDDSKKVYIFFLAGSYRTFASEIDFFSLDVPPSEKIFGLDSYDESICKKINKYQIHKIQAYITPEEEGIYLNCTDIKLLKRIIKADTKDGISVDIVQKAQYPADSSNLVDYFSPNRGILIKPIYANELYASNEFEGKDAKKSLRVYLGDLPEGIGAYELNAVIIKENCYCKTLYPTFLPNKGFEPFEEIPYLADTVTLESKINFIPESVDDEYMFRFPFADKVTSYKYEEIAPYLVEFDVPPYIVNEMNIAAFNSCDRSDNRNMIQIHKLSTEIVKAFQTQQTEKIKAEIVTSNGWTLFRDDVIGTKYESLAFLEQNQALNSFGPYMAEPEFQAILAKHRFAQIQLYVSYDIRGSKEQDYAIYHFNKAVEKNNPQLALAIQKFILKNRISGKYTDQAIIGQKIPLKPEMSGLMMNKLWTQIQFGLIDDEMFHAAITKLYETDSNNPYIRFNYLNSLIHLKGIQEEASIFKLQNGIDKLYKSTISTPTIDALNLDFQFNLIRALDTLVTTTDYLIPALDKVKSLTKLNETTEESALQLAYLFIRYDDFNYANLALKPYILSGSSNEELVFTYLSTAAFLPGEYYTGAFEKAFGQAIQLNRTRLKILIDTYKISMTIAENPQVKALLKKL